MLPSTPRIRDETVRNLAKYRGAPPQSIGRRLAVLDVEWDLEGALRAGALATGIAGLLLGAFVDRRLLVLPAAASAVLLQHARGGWSPVVPVLRRLRFRTELEIEAERRVLRRMSLAPGEELERG